MFVWWNSPRAISKTAITNFGEEIEFSFLMDKYSTVLPEEYLSILIKPCG